ncbi:relaxase/mobilization nuclease domain-containing protein [Actinosynnema sp. NPDC059335]|uniref:relaxase/mobilization nuclease domain-containing protein n=1 Tax=Actinosynnema sp. NPDC059335 TaxID=3346804 RepID=UPI00366BBEE9
MLPKLLPRHSNLRDTVRYLFAVGGRTVHTDPHIVAAWDDDLLHPDVARPNDQGGDRETVLREIITQLDAPRRLRHKTVAAGHVLHVPISAHHDDGLLGDQRWRELAEEFVARLGLERCRWIAVHHGTSKAGNDHVHLVVQLVDKDGKVARLSHSKVKSRAWAQEVEQRLGLVRTGATGTGARELTRAEHERADRTGVEPQRRTLERRVRAAAAGSTGPGEFVDILAGVGVQATPSTGGDVGGERVTGYRVALAEDQVLDGGPALRLSGGQLARELTLPELVDRWRRAREVLADDAVPDRAAVIREAADPAAWAPGSTGPMRGGDAWWAMAGRHVTTAAGLMDRLDLNDPVHRHVAVEQAAQFTAVLALRWPADPADEHQRRVADAVRRAADDLAAATRLWRPSPTSRPPRPRPLLPTLARLALRLARTGDTDLAFTLLALAALAALVIALADRITETGESRPPRGEPGAHLRAATEHLRPYQRRTTTSAASNTTAKNPAARVVEDAVERRLAASQVRLAGRPVPGVAPRRRAGPTR